MNHTCLSPVFILLIIIVTNSSLFSQDCIVVSEALKGTYTGNCKNGKASGKGKAVGEHTYEGGFKSGLPDGNGIYTWSNGDSYNGSFEKGLKGGHGKMTYKISGKTDSTIEGYWKKDMYIGQYEYPYKLLVRTNKVTKVDIKPGTVRENQITIWVSSTRAGGATLQGIIPVVDIANLFIKTGGYNRLNKTNSYTTKSETTLYYAWFPLTMQIDLVGGQSVEVVLNKESSYVIDITLNQ
jgi:hypothetical protein